MGNALVRKLVIILAILIAAGVFSFTWIRQQPVQLDNGTEEVCVLTP
jgi:hypothetical protein